MPTFTQMVDTVKLNLHGFTQDQEQYVDMSFAIGTTDTAFFVSGDTIEEVSRGLIEIDDELMIVLKTNLTSNVVDIIPGGRGVMGTTAATHAAHVHLINNPKYPRIMVKKAINDTIRAVYPDVFQVSTTEFTKTAAVYGYSMPANTGEILRVQASQVGPTKLWLPVRSYAFNPSANTTSFSTGKSIDVMDAITPGQTIRVVYSRQPTELSNNSDDFATVTGLSDSAQDLVIFGACYRLVPAYEAARLQQDAIESSERAQNVPAGSATQLSRHFFALYRQRLEEERDRLRRLYPVLTHFSY